MKNNKRTQGFTLIELLIVIAIIGILAAVLIPNLLGAQKRAYDTGAQSCAKSIQTAEATYQIDSQGYVKLSKIATAAAVTIDPKDSNGATVAATVTPDSLGISTGCANTNMVIATTLTNAAAGVAGTYSTAVSDTRGSKTATVTPSALTSAAGVQ